MFRNCVCLSSDGPIKLGTFVIVEVEKEGRDFGVVVAMCTMEAFRAERVATGVYVLFLC